jgi:hypothetical protein
MSEFLGNGGQLSFNGVKHMRKHTRGGRWNPEGILAAWMVT